MEKENKCVKSLYSREILERTVEQLKTTYKNRFLGSLNYGGCQHLNVQWIVVPFGIINCCRNIICLNLKREKIFQKKETIELDLLIKLNYLNGKFIPEVTINEKHR